MMSINRHGSACIRVFMVLIYLSFFLVQFNIHFSGSSTVSFFSSGYNTEFLQGIRNSYLNKFAHRDSKPSGIKLNKRFHPENLFITPDPVKNLVVYSFSMETMLIHEDQPLTQYDFNSPSLRGPPAVV